jgi:hypothetical protein
LDFSDQFSYIKLFFLSYHLKVIEIIVFIKKNRKTKNRKKQKNKKQKKTEKQKRSRPDPRPTAPGRWI